MTPSGKAYNIDWVFSNSSNVHVAKHLDWFTSYIPFQTKISNGLGESNDESQGLEILGVGDVSLPVKTDCKKKGRDSQGTLQLRDVLYMPGATCNILGKPRNTNFEWASIGEEPSKLIDSTTGACVGLLDLVKLWRLRLSGHSSEQTSLDMGQDYIIRASWPQSERQKWEAFQRKIADSEENRPANALTQSANARLTAVEKKWLSKHYGNEFEFLEAYGYALDDEQGRADSRRILRAIIEDDEKGWAELGLRLGHGDSDGDDIENEDEEDDDASSFLRELEEHPESHAADYHFSEEQLDWIKKHHSYSSNFLLSYGLKFYDDEDCKEGAMIVSQLMQDEPMSDSKERPTKLSGSLGESGQVGKSVNGHTSSGPSIPTLYDETHRSVWHLNPHVASIGHRVCLIAHLEHHEDSTDGSFGVCIAGGSGNFISQKLYESIPQKHRPALRESTQEISMMMGRAQIAIGETFVSILLKDNNDGKRFRVILHAYVLPQMLMGMFLSFPKWVISWDCAVDNERYYCDFGDGKLVTLKGQR